MRTQNEELMVKAKKEHNQQKLHCLQTKVEAKWNNIWGEKKIQKFEQKHAKDENNLKMKIQRNNDHLKNWEWQVGGKHG